MPPTPRRRTTTTRPTASRKLAGHIIGFEEPAAKGRNGHHVNWADIAEEIKDGNGKWALVKVNKASNPLSASRRAVLDGRYNGFHGGDTDWDCIVSKRSQGGFGLYVRWKHGTVVPGGITSEEAPEVLS